MTNQKNVDYYPSLTDFDRYLFLEAIQSAQDYLLMSYQSYSYTETKEMKPSLVIEELLTYLDKHYIIQGRKASQACLYQHPFDAFDQAYFKGQGPFINYSLQDYQAAHAYYQSQKNLPHCFVQDFSLHKPEVDEPILESTIVDLKLLTAVARNPIRFHLNQVLDIYLKKEETRQIKNEEDLALSALDKHILRQSALKKPLEHVLFRADKEGKLPFGLFKSVASQQLKDEMEEIHGRLEKYELTAHDLFQIEFSPDCMEPEQLEEDHWLFPPPIIIHKGYRMQVIGKLEHVSSKGLVIFSKGALADTWKAWPQFLAYHHAASLSKEKWEKQLILLHTAQPKKAFFEDATPYLKQFIEYYGLCLESFSPLMPEWLTLILQGDAKGLQDKMQLVFSDSFGEYQNHDVRWILNKNYLPSSEKIIQDWKEHAEALVRDLICHWHERTSLSGEL